MNKVVSFAVTKFSRCSQLLLLLTAVSAGCVSLTNLPGTIYADPHALAEAKANSTAPTFKPALDHLFDAAKTALKSKPVSVMDKTRIPPSGDKHDFISQAPYFWRDTNSPDGRYIRRDGERNPESAQNSDDDRVKQVCSNVHTLALAFYFDGNEEFAAHASQLLRVWFLNPATRMNPHLNFGQGIPGQVDGRPMGIIDTRAFVGLVDAVQLLKHSKSWTPEDQKGMVDWMTKYLDWLQTSKIGIGERDATNNHGTFYDTQIVAFAVFVGKTDLAKKTISDAREKRIAKQIEPDGKMPLELERTKTFSYSAFNLRALIDLASMGQNLGVDFWHYQTADGRSVRKALDFMAPYVDPESKWPYQQIEKPDRGALAGLLLRAAPEFPDAHYETFLEKADTNKLASSEDRLLFKTGTIKQ